MRAWVEGHLRAGEPLFGVVLGDRVVGVAGVSSSPSRLRYFRLLPALVRLVPALRPGAALALLRATRRPPAIPAPALTLDKIAVLPEFQGRGLGRRLMAHVHALCASDPEPAGVYLVTVGEGNRSFYEALGYRTVRAVPAAGVTVLHMFLPRLG
ncbi:GNAT family N-acetyltransferase [Candidatus Bipolaricaulota bacterium]|nr:GNAT family N-acetyltransferase [Candidatus Bipolaricaulota bacterium]